MEPEQAFRNAEVAGKVAAYLGGRTIAACAVHMGGYGYYNFLYVGNRALMTDIVPPVCDTGGEAAQTPPAAAGF